MTTTPAPPAAAHPLLSPAELQQYLHEHIPITRAMQVTVLEAKPDATLLAAPLAPNINHRDTVFGGSAAALATLAAWTLLHARLAAAGLPSRLVIQRNTMDYDAPIPADFSARATLGTPHNGTGSPRCSNERSRADHRGGDAALRRSAGRPLRG